MFGDRKVGSTQIWLVLLMGMSVGCKRAPTLTCPRPSDHSVVGCVDGVSVSRNLVESFVREPWWTPGSPVLPDAKREAVTRATRATLFAAEAKRRKLTLPANAPDITASWVQAFIADVTSKAGISRETISDAEATRQYNEHKELYNQLDRVDVLAIAFADSESAMKVYADAAKADELTFQELVAKHSVDKKSKANGGNRAILAADDEDHTILKVVLSAPTPGKVLGPFKASDGLWYILRTKALALEHSRPLDDLLKVAVKNWLVEARRNVVLDELEKILRARANIEVFEDSLATVTVRTFD